MLLPLATADAPASSPASSAAWPHSVQPFFLSAISSNLTSEDVSYLAQPTYAVGYGVQPEVARVVEVESAT